MSRTFTKLFSSITESTVWCEPAHTRLVWITMLAMADHAGRVWGSIPGLANRARVPLEDCETAIQTFLSPDPYSRTKDHEGRRIEAIDGGWRLLNHEKYRKIRDEESVKESKRRYINERRESERSARFVETKVYCRTEENAVERGRDNAEAEAEAEAEKQDQEQLQQDEPAAKPGKAVNREARLAQVTEDAIAAYNAALAKPSGLLPKVTGVGRDKRRQQVLRCVKIAREICEQEGGDGTVTPDFWATYFGACADDGFLSGRGPYTNGHANWLPDFEYLTRPAVLAKVYERTAG